MFFFFGKRLPTIALPISPGPFFATGLWIEIREIKNNRGGKERSERR